MPEPEPLPAEPSLKELGTAVADAAGVATGLWISYLFVLFYMLVAAAGVTHKDLFLQNGIKLPFLSVDLPLKGFFVLGPLLLLIVHAYVLLHFVLFADKARQFAGRRTAEASGDGVNALLPANIFLQMVAAPLDKRRRPTGRVSVWIAWATLVVFPVLVMMFFELQFLPFHSEWITWWHRLAVVLDLALLWWLWLKITCVNEDGLETARRRRFERVALGIGSFAACYLVFLVATWSGEALEAVLPEFPLHQTLVAGPVDDQTLRPSSPWSNRLVLASVDLLDHEKYDTPAKLGNASALNSFRGRHLERVVLTDATLPRSDFSSAHLAGASFVRVRAQGSWFDHSDLQGAQFDEAQIQGASFFSAHMPATSFQGALMQGGRLAGADLEGAWFAEANLEAASLAGSDLQYAMFDKADLRGANLEQVRLQGASLRSTKLEGVSLDGAYVWRADFRDAIYSPAGLRVGTLYELPGGPPSCSGPATARCENTDGPQVIRDILVRYDSDYFRERVLEWLRPELGPGPPPDWAPDSKTSLAKLEAAKLDDAALATLWDDIVCSGSGAPYIIGTMIDTISDSDWTRPHDRDGVNALVQHLLNDNQCAAKPAITDVTKMQLLDLPGGRDKDPAKEPPDLVTAGGQLPTR